MNAWSILALASATIPASARADVVAQAAQGFVTRHAVVVKAPATVVWHRLLKPAAWWLADQTFSGNAANLRLDPVANGCFCETLPAEVKTDAAGSVAHMRVVMVDPGHALRLSGGLGPLQSEAVNATLTITLKAESGGGTRILMEYVVGGYWRYPTDGLAAAIDRLLGAQIVALAQPLGLTVAGKAPQAKAGAQDVVLVPKGRVWSLPGAQDGPEGGSEAGSSERSAPQPDDGR